MLEIAINFLSYGIFLASLHISLTIEVLLSKLEILIVFSNHLPLFLCFQHHFALLIIKILQPLVLFTPYFSIIPHLQSILALLNVLLWSPFLGLFLSISEIIRKKALSRVVYLLSPHYIHRLYQREFLKAKNISISCQNSKYGISIS
jgi:hypothetical protein